MLSCFRACVGVHPQVNTQNHPAFLLLQKVTAVASQDIHDHNHCRCVCNKQVCRRVVGFGSETDICQTLLMCILSPKNKPPPPPPPPCHTYLYVPMYCISCYSATTKVFNGLSRQCYHLDQTVLTVHSQSESVHSHCPCVQPDTWARNGFVVHRAWSRAQQ